ncbi:hypothetical protein MMC12_007716 [Toensbergia leucococca]|nr:hypothetical protein [Toensbergia leucococca]
MTSSTPSVLVVPARKNSETAFQQRDFESKIDLESISHVGAHLTNTNVYNLAWTSVSVTVKDRQTKLPTSILSDSHGFVVQGQVLALMGPSGCGKTTLLNVLAHRTTTSSLKISGDVLVNGKVIPWRTFRHISCYVEQEDALIGSLTVHETLDFAARLALPSSVSKKERIDRIAELLNSFGIHGQANTIIGTPIRKGISGGQKRRVSVASQLITGPKILFLDEPTSGLDSAASFEVMSFIRNNAIKHNVGHVILELSPGLISIV